MLNVEHFFLIACDPRAGLPQWPKAKQNPAMLAAASLILDLAMQERIYLDGDQLRIDGRLPLSHPLLNDALHVLAAAHEQTVASSMRLLKHRLAPLPEQVLDGLYRRDLVHRIETRRWLFWKQVRYPLRSVQSRNEALTRLRAAAHGDANDLHGLALLLLADQSGLLAMHLDAYDHERAVQRLLDLGDAQSQLTDTHRVYAEVRNALLA
ncbi:MAG: GPP34 family phosphoprotein [Rudaea sp.]